MCCEGQVVDLVGCRGSLGPLGGQGFKQGHWGTFGGLTPRHMFVVCFTLLDFSSFKGSLVCW